jgi:class 3 adenylate cyclase/outer membrane protein assembly factor BamB
LPLFSLVCITDDHLIAQQIQTKKNADQYRAIHWSTEQGLSWPIINILLKDAKGFLWIGNGYGGLSRFDGAEFKKYIPDLHKQGAINSDAIMAFVEDSLHNIWMGTSKGLSRYDIKTDTFTNFIAEKDSVNPGNPIIPFWSTSSDVYCLEPGTGFITYNIHSLEKKVLQKVTDKTNRNVPGINYMIMDTKLNCVWMLEGYSHNPEKGGLLQISLSDGKRQQYTWPCYKNNTDHRHSAEAMQFDAKRNSIWINSGDGLLEFPLEKKEFHHIDALNDFVNLKDYNREVGIDIDIQGRIWLSTKPKGILIYDPESNSVQQLFSDPALQKKIGEANHHIYCDRDGISWTSYWGGEGGIFEMLPFDPPVKRYTANHNIRDSLSSNIIFSIVPANNGLIWIGTADGLNIFDPNTEKFEVLREKDLPGITGPVIIPLRIDTIYQKVWLSAGPVNQLFNLHIYEMDIKTRKCNPIALMNGSRQIDTFTIVPDFITPFKNGLAIPDEKHGLFEIKEGRQVADLLIPFKAEVGRLAIAEDRFMFFQSAGLALNFTFENKNGNWTRIPHPFDSLGWTFMLYNKKDHTYWVSLKYTLVHFNKDFREIKTYSQEDGYDGAVFNMQTDNTGNLWFINIAGQVGRINTTTGIITTLSGTDGYKSQKFDWFDPGAKDIRGNLYFGGNNPSAEKEGLIVIYPERYLSVATSSVYLRSLSINRKPFPLSTGINNLEELSLNYNENNISFETGIIDFHAKGQGHIRYKLEENGEEADWQYTTAYNTIRYENLPSGSYKLIMQASNVNNEFNSPEKILVIHISPPFWETWWFRTIAVIAILLLLYGIYRWRTATLRRQKRILEQTVKERTAEVVEEKAEVERQKEKSDELLLNILPSEVAEELKEKGFTTAKSFDEVTVLFSDIKGFTSVAEKLTAQELVKEINTYFSAFDNIILKYGLEKIKTIGDAYIAAGGLPEKNSATAQNVIEAAIAMQQVIQQLKDERVSLSRPYFELRIGIHTGHVVAGVVGIKKFQYDIWGDTVNIAARMEQSGVPGKINISQQTYELVKEQFNCVHRGKIEAKNKGEIDMYFVE